MNSRMVHSFIGKAPTWSEHGNSQHWSHPNRGALGDQLTIPGKDLEANEVLELTLTPDSWRTIAALIIGKFGMAPNIKKAIDDIPPAFDRT